jgi:adenylyltransferase/sulfurtransferase
MGYSAALYLAAAGVGEIDWYAAEEASSSSRLPQLRDEVTDLNPDVSVRIAGLDAGARSTEFARIGADLLLSTTTNPVILAAVNAVAVEHNLSLVVGYVRGMLGWTGAFVGQEEGYPCLRCWEVPWKITEHFAEEPATAGVIAPMAVLIALKMLLGLGGHRWGTVLQYDGETSRMTDHPVAKRPDCSACALSGTGS